MRYSSLFPLILYLFPLISLFLFAYGGLKSEVQRRLVEATGMPEEEVKVRAT